MSFVHRDCFLHLINSAELKVRVIILPLRKHRVSLKTSY